MINMDTEKDYGEAHLNPLQRQNGSLSNFGVLKCLCTPGEDMH